MPYGSNFSILSMKQVLKFLCAILLTAYMPHFFNCSMHIYFWNWLSVSSYNTPGSCIHHNTGFILLISQAQRTIWNTLTITASNCWIQNSPLLWINGNDGEIMTLIPSSNISSINFLFPPGAAKKTLLCLLCNAFAAYKATIVPPT